MGASAGVLTSVDGRLGGVGVLLMECMVLGMHSAARGGSWENIEKPGVLFDETTASVSVYLSSSQSLEDPYRRIAAEH